MTSGHDALLVLDQLKPAFHPDPSAVGGALENQFIAGPREVPGAAGASYSIGRQILDYIAELPASDWTSIETGCGYSTVILASVFGTHISVNPDLSSNRLVREFIARHIGPTNLRHVEQSSDQGLPGLVAEGVKVELGLIDGNHSHPFPLLDFHFMDQMLSQGGRLLIDNLEIEAVKELTDFLDVEPAYKLERVIANCGVFRKVQARSFGWKSQTLRRASPELDLARRELAQLRMQLAPDLRAALSGSPLPSEASVPSSTAQTQTGSLDRVHEPESVTTEPQMESKEVKDRQPASPPAAVPARRLSRFVKWYLTPSGILLAASLLMMIVGFASPETWRLAGVLGVILLGVFLPYRFVREQRRTDQRIRSTLTRDVRPRLTKIRSEMKGRINTLDRSLAAQSKETQRRIDSAARLMDQMERSIQDLRESLSDSNEAQVDLADRLTELSSVVGSLEASMNGLADKLQRGGRSTGLRPRLSGHAPEMHHGPAVVSLLEALGDKTRAD